MNVVSYVGRATRDAEYKILPNSNGKGVCNFTIAVNREYLSKELKDKLKAEGKPTADFIQVEVKTGQAEACGTYIKKGLLLSVIGRTKNIVYEKEIEGVKHVFHRDIVSASNVGFLEWRDISNTSGLDNDSFVPAEFNLVDDDDMPF